MAEKTCARCRQCGGVTEIPTSYVDGFCGSCVEYAETDGITLPDPTWDPCVSHGAGHTSMCSPDAATYECFCGEKAFLSICEVTPAFGDALAASLVGERAHGGKAAQYDGRDEVLYPEWMESEDKGCF